MRRLPSICLCDPRRCRARPCRHRAGSLAVFECHLAADEGVLVTIYMLHEAAAVRGQIENHLRRMQP